MRVSITTKKSDTGWTVDLRDDTGAVSSTRILGRCGPLKRGFPLPPSDENASWQGQVHAPLCEAAVPAPVQSVYDDVMVGDPGKGGIEKFGRYLSAVLFGGQWAQLSTQAGKTPVEIALYFESADAEMQRLPWEMMYGAATPLAADPGNDVAITRVVTGIHTTVESLSLPLRVLFVIGRQLDDALRPGAEYLGLLRRMKMGFAVNAKSVDLDVKLLTEATSDEIESAVNEFKPDVVHLICHGDSDGNQSYVLLTKRENDGKKSNEPDFCAAGRLLNILRRLDGDRKLPGIVVLNACHTADAAQSSERKASYLSFAADLVAGGVSVAIGMAGEVADGACRIFTRSFYQALISEKPIALAAARGRRAAMLHFTESLSHVEWARPTIFIADGAPATLSVNAQQGGQMMRIGEIASKYRRYENPGMLCDRFECLQAYQSLHAEVSAKGPRKTLVFGVTEPEGGTIDRPFKFGKTRLLEEVAGRAVIDGYIPCLVRSDAGDPPSTLMEFALKLAEAMDATRENFGLQKRQDSQALALAFNLTGVNPVSALDTVAFLLTKQTLKTKLKQIAVDVLSNGDLFKAVMIADLRILLSDVQAQAPDVKGLLVLVDDLHRYEGVADRILNIGFIGEHGLGEMNLPVPFIFTYSLGRTPTSALNAIRDFLRDGSKYAQETFVNRFRAPHERLAYTQYLLSRKTPLSVTSRRDLKTQVEKMFKTFGKYVDGVPSEFHSDSVKAVLDVAIELEMLIDADDETIVRSLT